MLTFNQDRLVALREARGLTTNDFAEQIGTTVQHLWLLENKKNLPSMAMLLKIMNAFEVPPSFFFTEEKEAVTK